MANTFTSPLHQRIRKSIRKSNRKVLAFVITFASFILLTLIVMARDPSVSIEVILLGASVFLLGILPSIHYFLRDGDALPIIALHGFWYSIAYGLPSFFNQDKVSGMGLPIYDLAPALKVTIVALLALYVAYYLIGARCFNRISPLRFSFTLSHSQMRKMGFACYAIYLSGVALPMLNTLPTVPQLLRLLNNWSIIVLLYEALNRKLSTRQLWLFCFILVFEFMKVLSSGALAGILVLGMTCGILYWLTRKRMSYILVAVLAIFFVFFNSVKGEYRQLAWGARVKSTSVIEESLLFFELAINNVMSGGYMDTRQIDSNISRLNNVSTLGAVMDMTPSQVPYCYGETYKNLAYTLIPRFLWPGKPRGTLGQDWAHRYGFLGPSDYATSFNLPWLPEMYINFGIPGVIMGMMILGLVFRYLRNKFRTTPLGVEGLVGVLLTVQLAVPESAFAISWGLALPYFITIYLTLLLTRATWSR